MKKLLTLSVALLSVLIYACGSSGYNTTTRNNNNSSASTQSDVDPASKFNTLWVTTDTPASITDTEKRTLANFFGYNTAHIATTLASQNALDGFVDGNYGATFAATDPMRNYFRPSSPIYRPFPAPMDLGTVSSYKIRFAADVDDATREVIPGKAFLDITVYAGSATLKLAFDEMKSPLAVSDASCIIVGLGAQPCQRIMASWKDDCGDIAIVAYVYEDKLMFPSITYRNSLSSYKDASCYYGGTLPTDILKINTEIPNALPSGVSVSPLDAGRGQLFQVSVIPSFIEQ